MTTTGDATKAAAGELRLPTLALHLAERNRLRAERAARLARLRAATPEDAAADPGAGIEAAPGSALPGSAAQAAPDAEASASETRAAALEALLRDLAGAPASASAASAGATPAAEILHFARGTDAARTAPPRAPDGDPDPDGDGDFGDLGRLPGAGPGLVAMLRRERLGSLAAVAALSPAALAARLGPAGRLVPLEAWIDTARQATAGARPG